MAGALQKRIEILEAKANSRAARHIIIEVDGNLPDDDAAIDALLEPLCLGHQDVVIAIKKFAVSGIPPSIISVT